MYYVSSLGDFNVILLILCKRWKDGRKKGRNTDRRLQEGMSNDKRKELTLTPWIEEEIYSLWARVGVILPLTLDVRLHLPLSNHSRRGSGHLRRKERN